MRRLFVPPQQLAEARAGLVQLEAGQARYLSLVLRLAAGDAVEVFDGKGARIAAQLVAGEAGAPALRLSLREGDAPSAAEAGPHVVLAQALSKGEKLELVVQKATELGVARIIPFAAERSVVRLEEERGAARAARWRRIAQEAARQCGRDSVPEVDAPARWDDLFALVRKEPALRAILLDTAEAPGLAQVAQGPRLLVAVGPEGGFSPQERARALESGFVAASLGRLTLRTETAGLAALAVIQHLHGQLG